MLELKIQKINDNLKNKKYSGPSLLYKYRAFDKYTFDMLENNYVFLCKARNLDDKTECNTSYEMQKYYDVLADELKIECINQIIKMIKPYCLNDNFDFIYEKIMSIRTKDGNIPPNLMLELSNELQSMVPNYNIAPLINYIVNIPNLLESPEYKPQIDLLLNTAINAKDFFGVCSLSESKDINEMWENYTDNYSGYCIEYDVSDYEFNSLIFPVIYDDDRETNIVIQLVGNFLGTLINGFSNGEANADESQFIRLFLTKNIVWSYQKEWRILGDANRKLKAPKIRTIYLGKNINLDNKNKMIEFCQINNINIYYMKK